MNDRSIDRAGSEDVRHAERVQDSGARRSFLARGAAVVAGLGAARSASAEEVVPGPVQRVLGQPLGGDGSRSTFVRLERVCGGGPGESERACDIFSNNSKTPLQSLFGTITPSDLHFERSHSGTPVLDPMKHQLLVHGLTARSTVFSMRDIVRMPSTTRVAFIECAGNGWDNWKTAKPELTVQDTHGLISTSEWTGVPLSFLLGQVGVGRETTWMLAEGADGAGVARSIPLTDDVLQNGLLAYGQNGEPLRPANGYPLRLVLPGYEGNMNIKWLRRLKFSDRPFDTRWETAKYTDLLPDGKARKFTLRQGPGSVITSPSGGMQIGKGFVEIRGLAWSGYGKVRRVDVSTDGGAAWSAARIVGEALPRAQCRFVLPWTWAGEPAGLQSRCVDEKGNVQPSREALVSGTGTNAVYHYNAIQTWRIDVKGRLSNALA